jgi:pyrroloquinoline quinone biosynthesis protein B
MGQITTIVLGSAAGGGFPQWNCYCQVCRLAWAGDERVKTRTQASLAISGDGLRWVLLNASPDLRTQLQATAELRPRKEARDSPVDSVVLTGAEVDQTAGLLTLRERQPFTLHATNETLAALAANPMFNVLAPDVVTRMPASIGQPFSLPGGLEAELFAVPGKLPLYLEGPDPDTAREDGINAGLEITSGRTRLLFIPGAAAITSDLRERCKRAAVIFFDGTLFSDDEMIKTGTGSKTGRRMGHMPIDGADGSLAALAGLRARRIYVHINNTNPILIDGSPERRKVEATGWEVGEDGMRIAL